MRSQASPQPPFGFHGITLDEFQAQAIWHLQRNVSTLVSAPTGTGKTLIADYLVETVLQSNKRLVYCGPVKALVNQKFRDFRARYGPDKVGIITGDLALHHRAPVLIVTTEIIRNMLLRGVKRVRNLQWVVLDEIHYLNHPRRGTVWEQAILLMPPTTRILGLSATVPNVDQIAEWIEQIHNQPVAVVRHSERSVPLKHFCFVPPGRLVPADIEDAGGEALAQEKGFCEKRSDLPGSNGHSVHLYLTRLLRQRCLFPCLYFVFSRKGCERRAADLGRRVDYLKPAEKRAVQVTAADALRELGLDYRQVPNYKKLMQLWLKGVGFHHAGLLPALKHVVEVLLARRLLRVLFTTETFAVGVNLPVRTVVFDTLYKHDGYARRLLTQQEFFQMAGRAGRRGMDKEGTVIYPAGEADQVHFGAWREDKLEPIESQMHITYNMTANLTARFAPAKVRELLGQSLAVSQAAGDEQRAVHERLWDEYCRKRDTLLRLGHLDEHGLTDSGRVLRAIFHRELLVTALVMDGLFSRLCPKDAAALACSLVAEHEPAEQVVFQPKAWMSRAGVVAQQLENHGVLDDQMQGRLDWLAAGAASAWAEGESLKRICQNYGLEPGDFVNLCRRGVDLLRQVRNAAWGMPKTRIHTKEAAEMINRDVVRLVL